MTTEDFDEKVADARERIALNEAHLRQARIVLASIDAEELAADDGLREFVFNLNQHIGDELNDHRTMRAALENVVINQRRSSNG